MTLWKKIMTIKLTLNGSGAAVPEVGAQAKLDNANAINTDNFC